STTAEGQIEVINALIAQNVNAIAISANDPDAVVPALKKAMARGIKVISWDSAVAKDGRIVHLNPSSNELIGKMCLQLAAAHLPDGKGDFAILSATTTSTNQNTWIAEMKKQLPNFPGLNLVTTVYGDDLADKSYREAQGLLTSQPNVKVIVAPTTVGVLAASQAVSDAKKIGTVYVTGLGLPSEMAGAIKSGATKEFAIWNPIDLGYSATQIAYHLVKGDTDGKPGSEITAGRMGKIKIGDNGEAAMADPFVYDAKNIDQFSKIF
ncbi:MAG: rhamnose ABC transporter substrate-binding protein, partial [Phyllobacterium sp.]|nr:rhamnose ABC transporter substrate-binding protein [Phyllobacterium sp.]